MKPGRVYFFLSGIITVAEGIAMCVAMRPVVWSLSFSEWYMTRMLTQEIQRRTKVRHNP